MPTVLGYVLMGVGYLLVVGFMVILCFASNLSGGGPRDFTRKDDRPPQGP